MAPVVREVATGLRFPEGPIAMPDGSIVLVECERRCVSRVTPDGAVTQIAVTGGSPNGAAIEVIFPMLTPNGIGLSPDEDRLYIAETLTGRVWAFDIVAPGEIDKKTWPQSPNGGLLLASMEDFRNLDSMAVDGAGNVCVATLGRGGRNFLNGRNAG